MRILSVRRRGSVRVGKPAYILPKYPWRMVLSFLIYIHLSLSLVYVTFVLSPLSGFLFIPYWFASNVHPLFKTF
jgi:hypothetical protein